MISQEDPSLLVKPSYHGLPSSSDSLNTSEPDRPVVVFGDQDTLVTRQIARDCTLKTSARRTSPSIQRTVFALADQFVVSGTNFFTTIIVGRACGVGGLGLYMLAFTLLVVIICAQESLVLTPYTVYCHRLHKHELHRYAGSVLVHHGILAALTTAVLATCAVVMAMGDEWKQYAAVTGVLAAVLPFALFRDFMRRFAFAHLQMSSAFALDALVAVLQVGGLVTIALTGMLTSWSAYIVIGLSCAAATASWFGLARPKFEFCRNRIIDDFRKNWKFGRWVFAALMTLMFQLSAVPWLLALTHGTHATGFYAACVTIVMLANPMMQGISNLLVPRAAQAFAEGGREDVHRVIGKTTLLMALTMVPFCGAVMLIGADLVEALYGHEYSNSWAIVSALSFAVLARALGMPAYNGLRVMGHPEVNFWSNLLGLAATIVTCLLLMPSWGVFGAACGLLAGDVTGTTVRWTAFFRLGSAPRFETVAA